MEGGKSMKLWNKNFIIITIGTFISITGGTAMSLALSILIFDQTSSTWLSAIYTVVSLLPSLVLPFLIAPFVDHSNPKKLIVGLDLFTGLLYLLFLFYAVQAGFHYYAYLLFSVVINCVDTVYDLSYQCLYPDLIPNEMKQKGYAVSAMVEPLATAIIAPMITIFYTFLGIEIVFLIEGVSLICAAIFESFIEYEKEIRQEKSFSLVVHFKNYKLELFEGFRYLKKEKGILNICSYAAIHNATTKGRNLMMIAYFQTSPILSTTMYSLLVSTETIGRFIGGIFNYLKCFNREKRYHIIIKLYSLIELFDGITLFMAYPIMIVLRFVIGFLGVSSSTLKEVTIQNYFDSDIRARVNGLNNIAITVGILFMQLCVGALGEIFSYSYVVLGLSVFTLCCMFISLVKNKNEVEKVYLYKMEVMNNGR